MREILFRAKSIDNGEWVQGYYLVQNGRGVDGASDSKVYFIMDSYGTQIIDPQTVCQFTGLTDNNGLKIWEGDIVGGCNGSINGKGWGIKPFPVLHSGVRFDLPYYCWNKDGSNNMDSTHWCVVIGNIFDNPELLTQ